MTSRVYENEAAVPGMTAASGRRTILLAPLGWYTRYMLGQYFRHALVVIAGLLIVALMIDISPRVAMVLETEPPAKGIWTITRIVFYLLLRCGDMLVPLIPIGCFLGTLWCEMSHTWSRERLMIWNSGRSPAQCLVPVLVFGLCMGVLLVTIESGLRPWIMNVQASLKLGEHGVRFSRASTPERRWISAGDDLLNARVEFGPPPGFRDLAVYRMGPDGRVNEVFNAQSATPGQGPNVWVLSDVHHWKALEQPERPGAEHDQDVRSPEAAGVEERLPKLELVLHVDPLWLSKFGVEAKFLSIPTLFALAYPSAGIYPLQEYRTWVHARAAQLFLPGGMALLATSLSLWLLAYGARNEVLLGIALAGYVAHVVMKAALLMGDHGYLAPAVSGWFTPVLLWLVSGAVLALVSFRGFAGRAHA